MRPRTHFEPFVHLVDVGPDRVLVAWGGFWFRCDDPGGRWRVLADGDLDEVDPGRTAGIGASSAPYGRAEVEVLDAVGQVVGRARTADVNHVWVTGLSPDTAYSYRITVDGCPWDEGERWDWGPVSRGGLDLRPAGRSYTLAFRTHPAPDRSTPLDFAVLGDFGVGVVADTEAGRRQRRIAEVLERVADSPGVRLVLTVGDNVYATPGRRGSEGSGASDCDWYGSFYQPYRYVLARVPVYPTVGNHDTADEESSDDRTQIRDNFHTDARFTPEVAGSRASVDPGMFYRLAFGADVEFVCLDTSLSRDLPTEHFFEHPRHQRFLHETLTDAAGPRWRIPFSHHPVYCAGPHHANTAAMIEHLVPVFRRAGVRVAFAGHEHNFQVARVNGIDYVVSGAGGQVREERPAGFAAAGTLAWSGQAHLLLARIDGTAMALTPVAAVGRNGELEPVTPRRPDGRLVEVPLTVELDRRWR
ncbi:metallophosphoesterase [Geodermatophilus sp. DSM 44513]|uniref:metallophosphoesterase n=1 Tax=Geodermatophilus sp. DSM 44513 TaxID=1528104 RepID=UPI00126BEE10|nr:metallophosphoesterase [Geodermatophilus sp. DSM 44513]WNV77651.1 metallophosphoesterase [Geodermatophilus sp. DSM 44513]